MKFFILIISATLIILTGCKKFVEVPPPITRLVGSSVYTSNSTAAAAITGIYQSMTTNLIGGGPQGISAILGLSCDEFKLFPNQNSILNQIYTNSLTAGNMSPIWEPLYNCIYQSNLAIENLSSSTGVTSPLKEQLIGEAKFTRAYCYFYLLQFFGDIPLVKSTDYVQNSSVTRSLSSDVYAQIEEDLKDAKKFLSENYVSPSGTTTQERTLPNKLAAAALLSRVFLYQKKWSNAEAEATYVITNPLYRLETQLNNVFLPNNAEAILQLQPPNNGFNAPDGSFLDGLLFYGGPQTSAPFLLSDSLVNSFEAVDLRRAAWITQSQSGTETYYYPFKYKLSYTGAQPAEYPVLLRLAEIYLIRSESRLNQNNVAGAKDDLNKIRTRAGLPDINYLSTDILRAELIQERRHELFTEYGHRWGDLIRMGKLDEVMETVARTKGGAWNSTDKLFPIPLTEIQANGKLIQNPGYK